MYRCHIIDKNLDCILQLKIEHADWNLEIASSLFYLCNVQSNIFFIKHFSISPILYEDSTLINYGFLIKGRH